MRVTKPFAWLAMLIALIASIALYGYAEATATPVVRHVRIALPGWPADAPPVRALLISDIHVIGPEMPPRRLARIVRQINTLRPDVVLIAGDFISEKRASTRLYSMADAIAPLAKLTPRLGTFVVFGDHDHWYDPDGARRALGPSARTRIG